MPSSPRVQLAIGAALFVLALPMIGLTAVELENRTMAARDASAQEAYYLPPARLLRGLTFGYNELAADLIWIRVINYFTDQLYQKKEMIHVERYLRTILALDDHFKEIYRFGPVMMLSQKGSANTSEEVMAAIRLLKQANRIYPDDWGFAKSIGTYYMFELKPTTPEEKSRYKRLGADWIQRAALLGANVPWLPSLAAKIFNEQGEKELAIQHLREVYLATQDKAMKESVLQRLKELQAAKLAEDLKTIGDQAARAYQESAISYVPSDLFLLVQQPELAPFSLRQAAEGHGTN